MSTLEARPDVAVVPSLRPLRLRPKDLIPPDRQGFDAAPGLLSVVDPSNPDHAIGHAIKRTRTPGSFPDRAIYAVFVDERIAGRDDLDDMPVLDGSGNRRRKLRGHFVLDDNTFWATWGWCEARLRGEAVMAGEARRDTP